MSTGPDNISEVPTTERETVPLPKPESEARTIPESPEKLIEMSDDDIVEYIDDAQTEADKLLAGVEKDLPPELAEAAGADKQAAQAALAANGEAMGAVAAEAKKQAEAVMAGEELPDLTTEAIAHEAEPAEAIADLVEKGQELDYEEKVEILLPALEAKPELGAMLDEVGLSPSEKRGVMLRLARSEPMSFFEASRSAGVDFTKAEKMGLLQGMARRNPALLPEASSRFGLSHEDLVTVIGRFPPSERRALLGSFKVPTSDRAKVFEDFSDAEKDWFVEGDPGLQEARARVEAVDGAGTELMLAIEEAFPERAQAERERAEAEQALRGKIEAVGELGGGSANKPLYVNIEGRLMPACYKPKRREEHIRAGIEKGESVGREALAAFVDRALQLDLVPPTVLRDGPEGIGTVQDWKIGKIAHTMGKDEFAPQHSEQLTRLAFFDWLTTNSDRHDGNWLVSPDGKHQAIDNGAIFAKRVNEYDGLRSMPSEAMKGRPLPPELRRNVERLLDSPDVLAALQQGFAATLSKEDAKNAWMDFRAKLDQVRDDPDFTIKDTEWMDFP